MDEEKEAGASYFQGKYTHYSSYSLKMRLAAELEQDEICTLSYYSNSMCVMVVKRRRKTN